LVPILADYNFLSPNGECTRGYIDGSAALINNTQQQDIPATGVTALNCSTTNSCYNSGLRHGLYDGSNSRMSGYSLSLGGGCGSTNPNYCFGYLTGYDRSFPHRTNTSEIWSQANPSGATYGSGQSTLLPWMHKMSHILHIHEFLRQMTCKYELYNILFITFRLGAAHVMPQITSL
jgi:hypothetical protein